MADRLTTYEPRPFLEVQSRYIIPSGTLQCNLLEDALAFASSAHGVFNIVYDSISERQQGDVLDAYYAGLHSLRMSMAALNAAILATAATMEATPVADASTSPRGDAANVIALRPEGGA